MGLDMHLEARHYYGGQWKEPGEFEGKKGHTLEIKGEFAEKNGLTAGKIKEITEEVAYWRKANAIHGWFVRNVYEDIDNCQSSWVRRSQLKELVDLCKDTILALDAKNYAKAERLLPPTEGFFFGQYDVKHEWYREELEETILQIEKVLKRESDCSFYYSASW